MLKKIKDKSHVNIVVKTDSFADIEYVNNRTRELCNEVKKTNPHVDLTIEVDLRRN